jgi:hypothetical protein
VVEQVDAIRSQPLQGRLGYFAYTLRPTVLTLARIAPLEPELGGDHHLIAERLKRFAQKALLPSALLRLTGSASRAFASLGTGSDGAPDVRRISPISTRQRGV